MSDISFFQKIVQVLGLKCPNCGHGKVFKKDSNRPAFIPEMNSSCHQCGHVYDREPGYFLGAMYASYGLAVFEGMVAFLIVYFLFPQLSTFVMALIPALVIISLSVVNYKLSRVIWMNLFPRH